MLSVVARNIEHWGASLDARSRLPLLVRRLVHSTIQDADRVDFPALEGVQRAGWDGIVSCASGNAFVPSGISLWELGCNSDVRGKADDDFKKRSNNPLGFEPGTSSFIFVTPRKWTKKREWCGAKRELGEWADVRAYDSDDLEQWLELAPTVAAWFARVLGLRPQGVEDIERYWEGVSSLTEPSLLPDVFVASREDTEEKFAERLTGAPQPVAIETRSPTEAVAHGSGGFRGRRDTSARRDIEGRTAREKRDY